MPFRVNGGRLLFYVAMLCTLPYFIGETSGSDQLLEADPTSPTAMVQLSFVTEVPEISKLSRYFPSEHFDPSHIYIKYNHSILQELGYDARRMGPTGLLILPDHRMFSSHQSFTVSVAGEQRRLIPMEGNLALETIVRPGGVAERWTWSDGIVMTRVYFQPQDTPAVGVRCIIHNQSGRSLKGLRFGVMLYEPEVRSDYLGHGMENEQDDELFVDPRDAVLFQRDYQLREESWVAHGWSLEGGYIKAGENIQTFTRQQPPPDIEDGLAVNIETPAKDLESGQLYEATFYSCWGIDRDAVSGILGKARKKDYFHSWETANQKNATRGLTVSSGNHELDFYFQMLKTWAGWMIQKDQNGVGQLIPLDRNGDLHPENVLAGLKGFLYLGAGNNLAVENYLDSWLDQRVETADMAYAIIIACEYVRITGNQRWFEDNAHRFFEWVRFYIDMDRDGDGIPEYHTSRQMNSSDYGILPEESEFKDQPLCFVKHILVSIWAYQEIVGLMQSEVGNSIEKEEISVLCQAKSKAGKDILEQAFWYPNLGQSGFYAYASSIDHTFALPVKSVDPILAITAKIGSVEKQKKVFYEIWNGNEWRDRFERYHRFINDPTQYTSDILQNVAPKYAVTQAMFNVALKNNTTVKAAVQRLDDYLQGVIYNPSVLAMPGCGLPVSAICIENLNLIEMIIEGLGGVELLPEGIRVSIPAADNFSPFQIENIAYRKFKINIYHRGKGEQGTIVLNGKRIREGEIISFDKIRQKRVDIQIIRKPAKKTKK